MPDELSALPIWQDREIRFDVPLVQLQLRHSEYEIDSINSVEDTKGNNGDKGQFIITNLRVIWLSHANISTNLSIGYTCIVSNKIALTSSKLKGNTNALYLMTKHQNSRFEFIFTSLVKGSPRLFSSFQSVIKSYDSTRLYRELKLRGAIIYNKSLILLPDEIIYNCVDAVWNLSSDQGNLGTLFITNIRCVWYANLAENFNVSIPYIQINSIKVKDSKFGHALVIETSKQSGGYILGFRIDPYDKLQRVYNEVNNMYAVYSNTPIFGIKYINESKPSDTIVPVNKTLDDIIITQSSNVDNDKTYGTTNINTLFSNYYMDADEKTQAHEPVYCEQLGVAVEKLRSTVNISDLWNVVG